MLADNQLAITGSGWDPELLRLELGELKLGGFDLSLTGFGDLELKNIMADRNSGLTDPDDAPAVPEHPVSQTGDLWLLGRHRLLCGDSTVATDVARVLGGVAPHLMVTDPPTALITTRLGAIRPAQCTIPTRGLASGSGCSAGR